MLQYESLLQFTVIPLVKLPLVEIKTAFFVHLSMT